MVEWLTEFSLLHVHITNIYDCFLCTFRCRDPQLVQVIED